jgi:transcriptional regulator with XRE-family HTH domain
MVKAGPRDGDGRYKRDLALRLLRTRTALGLSQAEFCRQIGVKKNVYNPFERGRRQITVEVATMICERFGLSLDWIYRGDVSRLPAELFQRLHQPAA